MLAGKGEHLDFQRLRLSHELVEVDGQGMSGQLGQQSGAQPPKRVSMVELDLKLFGQLTVDGFHNLTSTVVQSAEFGR